MNTNPGPRAYPNTDSRPTWVNYPDWSPKGGKIAYKLIKKGSPHRLAVANSDGTRAKPAR